jgi:hypothetical protein
MTTATTTTTKYYLLYLLFIYFNPVFWIHRCPHIGRKPQGRRLYTHDPGS